MQQPPGPDINTTPGNKDNNVTSLNPYQIGDKLWDYLNPWMVKYGVSLAEAYPQARVTQPTVVWRIVHREPGVGNRKAIGPTLSRITPATPDGLVSMEYTQEQTVILEFAIFGISNAEVDRIAWDLECAILTGGAVVLQEIDPGIVIVFHSQGSDINFLAVHQDDLIVRTIRFTIGLPIRWSKPEVELRTINRVVSTVGTPVRWETNRTSSSSIFEIPVQPNQLAVDILRVYKTDPVSGYIYLEKDTDYSISRDSVGSSAYINWLDTYGATPSVGQDIIIIYLLSSIVYNVNKFKNT